LLIGASAAFLTTTPPLGGLLNFNEQGPYICLLLSFGLTLGGVVIGSSLLYALPIVQGTWHRDSLMASRSHVCCTLIFLTYPFITIGTSTVVMAMGKHPC
ncbi:uncharacterized protein STEHIDRAFT_64960, partial [Stereum hirsutum FP-91666 SS1]|uniref:uncharacterized protein n=1 Tax=Stereum hirsutum (strain FP-91666) TaxID=721885 RepID=UPI000444A81B